MPGRKTRLWLAAAIAILTFAAVQPARGADRERPCNGSVELCGKTLDQVVLPGTHNSMSNEEYGWMLPNQHYSIPTQLSMGVRAFLIDTKYGEVNGNKISNVAFADRNNPGVGMYLCHEYCQLGSSELIPELAKVAAFLADNPRQVLVFVVQDSLAPEDLARAVTDSGLIDYVYPGSTDQYPTLREMIASNQRVVMLSEGNTGSVPWYHDGYDGSLQETPYDFRENENGDLMTTRQGMDLLTDPSSLNSTCRPNRGSTTGPLFLMNHWVNGKLDNSNPAIPDPAVAQVLNQPEVLVARARACEQRRGKLPNIVAVDDFGDGDLISAVRELNGVSAKAFFEVTKPKNAVGKAGRKVTYKLAISNWGDAESALTSVCATVPGKLAKKPRCKTVNVPQGNPGKATVSIQVATRRIIQGRFKGKKSGPVRFKVSGAGDMVSTSASLKIKPVKVRKSSRR